MTAARSSKGYRPQDAAAGWALTMLRPLLNPRRRNHFENAMAAAFETWPDWCYNYVSGVLTVLTATLPNSDPWRHISARSGTITAGLLPHAEDGVWRDDTGRRWGTWHDATDIVTPVFAQPESDPTLAELADPLSVYAGLLIAAAGNGDWRSTRGTLTALATHLGEGIDDLGRPYSNLIGYLLRDTSREALAWVIHRQTAYGNDLFAEEILTRWQVIASNASVVDGPAGNPEFAEAREAAAAMIDDEVASTIARFRLGDETRDGISDVIGQDADLEFWPKTPF